MTMRNLRNHLAKLIAKIEVGPGNEFNDGYQKALIDLAIDLFPRDKDLWLAARRLGEDDLGGEDD